jgi:hypothetical protein
MALSEESKGLWHNIRAKRARGGKPARKGSDAYNKAVAAAKKINATNEEREEEEDRPARTITTGTINAMPNAYYEMSMCNECAIALLEDIKAGKILMTEAEYQGRKVPLGKPMRGDVKKFKVYVKKGDKVVKVNFGDPNMKIKKSNPARRKSFRARHKCSTPGPRHKARYWSCRKW